jgi:hypothetical protein
MQEYIAAEGPRLTGSSGAVIHSSNWSLDVSAMADKKVHKSDQSFFSVGVSIPTFNTGIAYEIGRVAVNAAVNGGCGGGKVKAEIKVEVSVSTTLR